MSSLLNPVTGAPVVNVAQVLADPKWAGDVPASAANPLINRVGWFNLNNINCGLLGMPLGFLVMIVVSLLDKEPSREIQAFVDEMRKPRGRAILQEKT
jgi:cation/acetate symporter